ncbi:acetyltransferase [Xylariaceae sp. FL1651]|nr:acetyltransferase [Xylariaceae sp. FL1651]
MNTEVMSAGHQEASDHVVPATAILVTDKCYLRRHETSDAEALANAANDREVTRYMRSSFPWPYTLDNAHSWIAHCQSLPAPVMQFCIFTLAGEFAGSVGLELPKGDVVYAGTREIGYFTARKFWGHGIMSSAVRGFVRWAFTALPDLLRIEACVLENNEASRRVLLKAGFVKEGTRRLAVVKNGETWAEDILGFTRQDLET